jgi:predicted TIM-barrel fold metal-dependent hydrolase
MKVVDAHVHLWDPHRLRYSWLDGTKLDRLIDASTLRAASGTVTDFVVVQADGADSQGLAEVEWLVEQSDQLPGLRGIVAFAPLERGADVRDYLAVLRAIPSVVGVRRLIQTRDPASPSPIASWTVSPRWPISSSRSTSARGARSWMR